MAMRIGRREFVALTAATGAGALAIASCTPSSGISLNQFIAMSALFCGFPQSEMSALYAPTYLDAANGQATAAYSLADLYKATRLGSSNPPATFDQLVANGFYSDPNAAKLADSITQMWYSGVFAPGSITAARATYLDALGWTAITWTDANTQCRGATNAWANLPAEPLAS
jgi:hypothetical protein